MITSATKLLGVIGWPVAHSRSPVMQNAAIAELGVDFAYLAFPVPPHQLVHALQGAATLGVRGLNVTIPHKEVALGLCAPDALAREVGAVNTLIFEGSRLRGLNTDVHGFRMMMAEAGVQPSFDRPGSAVILGAGGAARAVAVALRSAGYTDLTVVSRNANPVTVGGVALPVQRWEVLPRLLAHADLLIDATPRGLDPSAPAINLSPLPDHAVVLDLVVAASTALTEQAEARGLRSAAGASMLLHQGAASLESWTGVAAPVEIMREALYSSL